MLVVDDEPVMRRSLSRTLSAAGFETVTASTGTEALAMITSAQPDVVVSDIAMPGMDGIALLRAVRETNLDVPVVLITGQPTLETAVHAVEYGALRYLPKPFEARALQTVVEKAAQLHRLARIKRDAHQVVHGEAGKAHDRAGLEAAFERALSGGLYLAFQPIVSYQERRVVAYEALMRSREPALPNPLAMIDAAERLGRVHELGRHLRGFAADAMATLPEDVRLYVNVHPMDLTDDALYSPSAPLSQHAARVTLEVTERGELPDKHRVQQRLAGLRLQGYEIAIDDLGAGYAGLSSFAALSPESAKVDMSLVRGIDADPRRAQIVRSIVGLCREMGVSLVAEGVETAAERDRLVSLGCDWLQGYFFGRPEAAFNLVASAKFD